MKKLLLLSLLLCGCSAAYRQRKAVEKLDALILQQPNEFVRLSNLLNPCFNGKAKSDTVISLHTDTLLQDGKTDTLVKNNTVYVTKMIPIKTVKTVTIHDTIKDGRAEKACIIQLANKTDSLTILKTQLSKSQKEANTWRWAAIIAILIIFGYVVFKVVVLWNGGWIKKLLPIILVFMACKAGAQTDTVSLDQGNFHVAYDTVLKYPVKVTWKLTAANINCAKPLKRSNKFTADPKVKNTNFKIDYAHSGFDQGHQFNAADDACQTPELNAHCWYYTNMAPQLPNLNRIVWKALEDQCRALVKAGDELLINCGSIGKIKTIGVHKVAVPEYCWKTILHKDGRIEKYAMPNNDTVSSHSYTYYLVK